MNTDHDTIVAPATAAGGAIAVIRISGGEAFAVCDGYSGAGGCSPRQTATRCITVR